MKNIPDDLEHETIMILSHNPGCADFLEYLCGEWYRMPTAATALLSIKDSSKSWKESQNWELEELLLPRDL
jgi:phosphohistidine phosphatase SixA